MLPLKQFLFCCGCFLSASLFSNAREFTVLAYNVENLFDVDGVALYSDYKPDAEDPMLQYGREKLLTKLTHIVKVVSTINNGSGPEVILFQELEGDFTPASEPVDPEAFLKQYERLTVSDMLRDQWKPEFADISSALWLFKAMNDARMKGYQFVTAPSKSVDNGIAHTNAVFTRFPILESNSYPLHMARDILEVELDVDGAPFWVYANHWKSGASNREREPIRVENAKVLKSILDTRMAKNPAIDFVLGGDFNSHYNHALLFPNITTGINDILGSQGNETVPHGNQETWLYNLWYELEPADRYSEVWRGHRGTLMQLLVSQGLYDGEGISYVDNSFQRVIVPEVNADVLNRPLAWNAVGKAGGGVSDHFPVMARFQTGGFRANGALSRGDDAPDYEMPLVLESSDFSKLPNGRFLNDISDEDLGPYVDRLYKVRVQLEDFKPMTVEMDGTRWPVYVPEKSVYAALRKEGVGAKVELAVKPGWWKGARQFVIEAVR